MTKSDEQVREEFQEVVNMDADELTEWLETDESKSVGQSDDGSESKGHESGRRIVEILEKDDDNIDQDDLDHMRRGVSYVHRHQAQEPEEDVEDSRCRYSSSTFQTQRTPALRLSATMGRQPEIELALV